MQTLNRVLIAGIVGLLCVSTGCSRRLVPCAISAANADCADVTLDAGTLFVSGLDSNVSDLRVSVPSNANTVHLSLGSESSLSGVDLSGGFAHLIVENSSDVPTAYFVDSEMMLTAKVFQPKSAATVHVVSRGTELVEVDAETVSFLVSLDGDFSFATQFGLSPIAEISFVELDDSTFPPPSTTLDALENLSQVSESVVVTAPDTSGTQAEWDDVLDELENVAFQE